MPFVTRKSMLALAVISGIAGLAIGGFVWSGMYNVGADDPHLRPTYTMLRLMRERSIVRHTREVKVPDLRDPALISQGAGNFDTMCTGCHLAPGMDETELSKGLYPAPPNFSRMEPLNPAHAFWVTKHGIKASGMPAWGKSMKDEYIWGMVAFLQQIPKLSPEQYQAMVAGSGGHSHGGGETKPHGDAEGGPDHHGAMPNGSIPNGSMPMEGMPNDESKPHPHPAGTPADHHKAPAPKGSRAQPAPATIEHRHADGTVESHPAPKPKQADDGHDHEH